jgi:trans-aconitate methyltransferase
MNHDHNPRSGLDPLAMFTQEFWDARYCAADRIWSANPNSHLVAQVADLIPGAALDVGCGEGRRRDLAGRSRLARHSN